MDIRYSTNQKDFKRYTTNEVRDEFLIENLYIDNEIVAVYSHIDRMVTFGCMPTTEKVSLDKGIDCFSSFGTNYILERREIGIFNLGNKGKITVDGTEYILDCKDCLYITKGHKEVYFESIDVANPAKFYMVSAPAHIAYETKLITIKEAAKNQLGDIKTANKRVINQFIHPSVLKTAQLSMGLTELSEGNVWNTMPSHTHERRMEIYTYFDMPEDEIVLHLMGESNETRHIVMKNFDAVISPSWSIHSGCGTSAYSFIWAMGGENQEFTDMDHIKSTDLK